MRARNIKPGFFSNEDLAEMPPKAGFFLSVFGASLTGKANWKIDPRE